MNPEPDPEDRNTGQGADPGSYQAALHRANRELAHQLIEREKRADELALANIELDFQNTEKQKRADELLAANLELEFQLAEKKRRAAELVIANRELAFQNTEKENRAAELVIANRELAFQNAEKEKRAAELALANLELAFQNAEKEKRAAELLAANRELESFAYISSHHLQEPLRKIQIFTGRILEDEYGNLSSKGKYYIERTNLSAQHMRTLIDDIISYSGINAGERIFKKTDLKAIVRQAIALLQQEMDESCATVAILGSCDLDVMPAQFRQLLVNLISNSLKFRRPEVAPHISITSRLMAPSESRVLGLAGCCCHISITDNGIGFSMDFKDKIFEIFQKLHDKAAYEGAGIGLTIARKVVENHKGLLTVQSEIGSGTAFDVYIPAEQVQAP